ncbi:hypothetical protein LJB80_00255 [Bacteroides sp. OttesenSCG-928-F21]|nr:hypothetical protein [Bacteroides sp. OttesenSCG-928-F21]
MTGLLYINETDVYDVYGAYLVEDREGDHKNYDSLMKSSAIKSHVAVSFREESGEKYPDELVVTSEARDIDLQFAIVAPNAAEFLQRYKDFILFLKTGDHGWLRFRFPELNMVFRVFYKESTGYGQLTYFEEENEVAAKVKVKLREPNPSF